MKSSSMRHQRRQPRPTRSGFTLIELLIVVALIVILSVVLSSTLSLFGRKSLRMARNSMAGYFDGLRSEAVNLNKGILVVVLPNVAQGGQPTEYPLTVKQGESSTQINVSAGIIPFYIDQGISGGPTQQRVPPPWERVLYMDRNFIFDIEFDANVRVHPKLIDRWDRMNFPTIDNVTPQDLKSIGIPNNAFVVYIRPDGRTIVPGDVPGYIVDSGNPEELDGDLVLEDGNAAYFLDISPLARIRGYFIEYDLLPERSQATWRPLQ